jgi:tetratricopeptide (TPR) repeat protein
MARVTLQEYCDQARELIDGHQYTEAIAICRHILKRYPRHIRTYQILGEACLENGEVAEAIDTFKRLLENADPENLTAYAGLGVAYQEKGQLTDAIWYMEMAFELAPNHEETRNTLRQLYYQRDGVEPERIRHSKAALARLYARGGQYRQAIEEFRRLLEVDENRGRMDLKVSLAETLWRDGRREQAAELAREILQSAPDCLKALLLLGKITIEKGRQEEGKAILEQTRGLDPENRTAQALFGEASPLPPQMVLIPKMEPLAETPTEAVVPAAEAVVPEAEIAPQVATEAAVEPATATIEPPAEAIPPEAEIAPQPTEAAAVPPVISEEAELVPVAEVPTTEAPVVAVEPVPTAIIEEPAPVAVAQEPTTEEVAPRAAELPVLPAAEAAPITASELVGEEAPAATVEPVVAPVEEEAGPAATEAVPAAEAQAAETPVTAAEPTVAPISAEAAPKKKRGKRAAPQATVLEAGTAAAAGPLSDIERCQLLLEQKPKDDELRLALARAYRDGSQMKPALEQYAKLVRAKQKLLPDIIADVEGIVASRPDNLEAHELLADLYGKNGQLQKALERYRWVLERLREGEKA